MEREVGFKYFVIDRVMPFKTILKAAGAYIDSSTIFCPFHDDRNHKSAKVYHDNDGDKIWCFSERKMYKPSDCIKRGMVSIPLDTLYERVWDKIPQNKREVIEAEYSRGGQSSFKSKIESNKQRLEPFMKGEMSVTDFIKELVSILDEE